MKKLLFLCAIFGALIVKAQESESQFKKIMFLTDIALINYQNKQKTDSIISEITLIKNVAANQEVLKQSRESLKTIRDLVDIHNGIVPSYEFSSLSEKDLKEFEYRYDKFNKKHFIVPYKKGLIYPYIVIAENGVYMRFVNIFEKSYAIHWTKARFLYNEKEYEYYDENTDFDTSSSYSRLGGVSNTYTEKSDVFCTKSMIDFLREISTAKLVEGRLEGRSGNYDYTIGEKTKLRIAKVLDLYDKLKK